MKLLVIGDWILDRYVFCRQTRLNPEAPVPLLEQEREEFRFGGAAAVAKMCHELGSEVRAIGNRNLVPVNIREMGGLPVKWYNGEPDLDFDLPSWPLKTRFICDGRQVLRVDDETVYQLSHLSISRWAEHCEWSDKIVVSDYGKGVVNDRMVQKLARSGKPVIVDGCRSYGEKYRGATLLKVNHKEAVSVSGIMVADEIEEYQELATIIRKRFGIHQVVITLGSRGMVYEDETTRGHIPAETHPVADATGAGDTVTAALACFDGSLENLCRKATELAGQQVTNIGVASLVGETS